MNRIVLSFALLISLFGMQAAAAPAAPAYPGDSSRVLWFLVMSDQHITARDSDGPERLTWLMNEAVRYVEPDMVFNCGDLTDGSDGEPLISLYPGKQDDEWQLYRQILDDAGVTVDTYLDLPGNHDQYSDKGNSRYLQYSLAGSTFGTTQHSIVIDKPWGSYHFLGIDTSGNNGAGWPIDNAGLDVNELLFILRSLEDNADANLTLMFGHHPIVRPDLGFKLDEGSDEIQEFMGDHSVRAYFYGHTHEFRDLYWPDNDRMPVTLHENVDSFGKADEKQVLLVAIDNDNLHIRQVTVAEFPWVIVTTPADVGQGGGNPWAFDVPTGLESAPIRALGFTSDPFLSCQYSLDGGAWVTMDQLADHRYEGYMDTRGMAPGAHTVEVRALPGPSGGHKITFNVVAYTCGNGVDDDTDGLTDFPDEPGCDSVTDSDEYNDPVLPEPTPDVIEPDDAGFDAADVLFDTSMPDESAADSGSDLVMPEDIPGTDATVSDDNGPAADSSVGQDRGTGNDQGSGEDTTLGDAPVGEDDVAGETHGGGCSAGTGAGNAALPLVLMLLVTLLAIRRRAFR